MLDRRREIRFETNQPGSLRLLNGSKESRPMALVIRNCSGRGLCVELEEPVPPGTAVRIDSAGALFLGEITYCRPNGVGFLAGVEVEQGIGDTAELARLMKSVLGESSADPVERKPA